MNLRLWKTTIPIFLLTSIVFLSLVSFVFANETASSNGPADKLMNLLWSFVVNLFGGLIMGGGGILLNGAVEKFIVGFTSDPEWANLSTTIYTLWAVVRDLFNLTFIFGLVYIGFRMILDSENSQTRKWLVHLIIAALLINFSLYITQVVIDVSNILATEIAEKFEDPANPGSIDVSGTFMNQMGIQSVIDDNKGSVQAINGQTTYSYVFGSAIIFLIAGFVFGAGAILLTIRYVMLILFMILSPLMFLGSVFPGLKSVSDKYWRQFLGKAFFAPVYLLLLYFSSQVLESIYRLKIVRFNEALNGSGGAQVQTGLMESILPFIISSIFLVASIVIASKMGAEGANGAVNIMNNTKRASQRYVQRKAGDLTAGTAAKVSRNTVGRGAHMLQNSEGFRNFAASNAAGRHLYAANSRVAQSSFDVRQVGTLGKTGFGTGKKGGFAKQVEAKNKAELKFANDLGKVDIYTEDGSIKKEHADKIKENAANLQKTDPAYLKAEAEKTKAEQIKAGHDKVLQDQKTAIAKKKESATAPNKRTVETLEKDLSDMKNSDNPDPEQIKTFQQKIDDENEEIRTKEEAIDKQFESALSNINKQLDAATKDVASTTNNLKEESSNIQTKAKSSVVYARQVAYMKQLEDTANFWKDPITTINNTITPGAAGGVTAAYAGAGVAGAAGVGAAGALVATTAGGAHGYRTQQAASHLREKFGAHGEKKSKQDKKVKDFELLEQLRKEATGSDDKAADSTPDIEPEVESKDN